MTQQPATSLFDTPKTEQAQADWRQRVASILLRHSTQLGVVGYTGTITTAKLTTGGAEGSMTFVNGRLVSQTAAS
jgi:Na+-translocating ferredoxin:NAD+ oxidoreductase RnfC subunit